MFFKNLFNKSKKETPGEMLMRLKPELFDTSGKTYNGGIFSDSPDSFSFSETDIELFPHLTSVFNSITDFEQTFLLPLCTFDLKIIDINWTGKAYFLYYYKSQGDNTNTSSLINQYGDYNVTIFNLHDNKISYSGDKAAFQLTNDELEYWTQVRKNYDANLKSQISNKNQFLTNKKLNISKVIRQVGAIPMWVQSDETPVPVDGEEIFFIGQIDINTLIDYCGWIYLFYSPQKNLLIQVEQWT